MHPCTRGLFDRRHPVWSGAAESRTQPDSPYTLGRALAALLWFCLAGPLAAIDPSVPLHQFARDTWNQQQGLAGTAVYGIYQLGDHYLWLNTSGGLVRFDGARFVTVPPNLEGQALDETFRASSRTSKGQLLLRGRAETLLFDEGRFQRRLDPVPLPKGKVRVVHESSNGTLWIGADNQLYRVLDKELEFVADHVSWVNSIVEDGAGKTWFATNNGIYAYKSGRLTYYPAKGYRIRPHIEIPHDVVESSIEEGPGSCNVLLAEPDGTIVIGSMLGLWKLKDNRFFQDEECEGPGVRPVYSLLRDKSGSLWIGTDGFGLYRHAAGRTTHMGSSDGLIDDCILSLAEDEEGSVWAGTRSGLVRFRESLFQTLTEKDGLVSSDTWCVIEARDGSLFVNSASSGITRIRGTNTTPFTKREGLAHNGGGSLFEDRKGRIWATTDQGLSMIDGDRVSTFTAGGYLQGVFIPSIADDEKGLILGSGERKLYRFQDNKLSPFDVPLPPGGGPDSVRYVWHMHRDREGVLWMAMSAGLFRLAPGAPPEATEPTAFTSLLNSIGDDERGFLWLASTQVSGFTRYNKKDGTLVRYTAEAGAKVDRIARIIADKEGNLWMNTGSGIAYFNRKELDAFAEGKVTQVTPMLYGMLDGLRTPECGLVGPQPAAQTSRDGKLYLTSRKGLVVLDPNRNVDNPLKPPVKIEEIVVDGVVIPGGDTVTVRSGKERMEIHYTALSLRIPSRVKFRYKLFGYDSDWVDAGTNRSAVFTQLPPGQYTFQVLACNDSGVWNEEGASIRLEVAPRFFETVWFRLAGVGAFVGLVVMAFQWRVKQFRSRQQALRRIVDERTAELRREVDERIQAEKALVEGRDRLEQTVQERTSQLQLINERLQQKIKEHEESEERLRQAQKLEGIGKLAGGVAHDFNNLLTVINGYCEFWLDDPNASADSKTYAQEIKQAGTRAASLTQQLLAFSRKQVLQIERVDLNTIVSEMERMLGRLLREDIALLTRLNPRPCVIDVDPGQINQVILNLVVNARDALPKGGSIIIETHWVEVKKGLTFEKAEVKPGSYVQLNVTDTGTGMDRETLSHIFEPFFTTKELGKGTGLGLSTVFGIVKQSDGHISVYSEPGQGTTFRILFPRQEGEAKKAADEASSDTMPPIGGRILVVEDQEDVRALTKVILQSKGFTVMEAPNGQEALALAESFNGTIDVLFTDLVMPGMSGRELGLRIKALRPETKIIFTTGYTEDAVIHMGTLEPGFILLQKPFTAEQLLASILRSLSAGPRL